MKVSIFGLGYVGSVSGACLAKEGHHIMGVDVDENKINLINSGKAPIIEKGLQELVTDVVKRGHLKATTDVEKAILSTELSFVCVGTPSKEDGSLDLKYLMKVCEQIGSALGKKKDHHVVIIRSTLLPGTIRESVIPTLESFSEKKVGVGFSVCIYPEFMREGTAIDDFYHPPLRLVGETDPKGGDALERLYGDTIKMKAMRTTVEVAEMLKYCSNTWHAVKVVFANEVGAICKALDIDGQKVMDLFCKDTTLNISTNYLNPGFSFGGSCLPKDIRALTYKGRALNLHLPMMESLLPSNVFQTERALKMILDKKSKKIGILGLSFKADTDDVRESPIVEVIERLIGKGFEVKIYDKNVRMAKLVGSNKEFVVNLIPHIHTLLVESIEDILEHAEIIVVANKSDEFKDILTRTKNQQMVVDFCRISENTSITGKYEGISW